MTLKEAIMILGQSECGDPFECPASMWGTNKDGKWGCFAKYPNGDPNEENQGCIFHQIAKMLEKQQPKTGHWVEKEYSIMSGASAKCSECGERTKGIGHDNGFSMDYTFYDYCPYCGAKMEDKNDE